MPYTYSDHLGVRTLNSSINDTTTTLPLDALPSKFADDVEAADNPRFPIRIGGNNRASHERVVCTGVNRGSNELVVERDVKFGKESHNSGTRVAHPYIAESAAASAAKERALPEPWEPSDFLAADDSVAPTVDQVLTHYPWESIAGISKIPRFLLDFTRIEKIPNALQRNHVRSSKATRWDSSGDLVEDSSGTLRLQRDPATGDVLGLLYEPRRTQLLTDPTDLDQAGWNVLSGSVTADSGSNKGLDYDLLDGKVKDNFSRQTEGSPFAASVIVEVGAANTGSLVSQINDDDNSISDFPKLDFDLSAETVTASNTGNVTVINSELQDLGSGIYRVRFSAKPDSAWAFTAVQLEATSGSVRVYHAQAEVSREVTTPILQGGGVREADEVDYGFSFPDKTTGVAYSVQQTNNGNGSGANYKFITGIFFGTTSDDKDLQHGVLMWNGGINSDYTDGWKSITRNSDETDSKSQSPLDETIDRFEVRQTGSYKSEIHIVRQIAIFTQTLTSAQQSDLKSKYLTQP